MKITILQHLWIWSNLGCSYHKEYIFWHIDNFIIKDKENLQKDPEKNGNYETSQKGGGSTPTLIKKEKTKHFPCFSYEGFPKAKV